MTSEPTRPRVDVLVDIRQLDADGRLVPHEEAQALLRQFGADELLTPTEWNEVVDFSAHQLSRWQVEWLFSPAESPNALAASETEAWRALWDVYADALVKAVPALQMTREACLYSQLARNGESGRVSTSATTNSADGA